MESIDEESIFRPPEGEEWIEVYSEKKTPRKKESKKKNKVEISNPFDVNQMRPYQAQAEYSPTNEAYNPENNAKWGALIREPRPNINQQQQGFMSIAEVAGENSTTSGEANPKYKIPKKPNQQGLQADRLNQLAASTSPPTKEKKKDDYKPDQSHKNKKGRQYSQQGGTRYSRGGKRK